MVERGLYQNEREISWEEDWWSGKAKKYQKDKWDVNRACLINQENWIIKQKIGRTRLRDCSDQEEGKWFSKVSARAVRERS